MITVEKQINECYHCGKTARLHIRSDVFAGERRFDMQVKCDHCGTCGPYFVGKDDNALYEKAIDAWNSIERNVIENARWKRLKSKLFEHGYEAVSDFLGSDYPPEEDKDVTENRLDQIYDQMPSEEIERFFEKYGAYAAKEQ